MPLRRWHRLGLILTLVGGIAVFWGVFTRDDELSDLVHYRQTTECRVAERRGLPADKCYREVEARRAALLRQRAGEAALATAAAIVGAWVAAFLALGAYRWIMAGAPAAGPATPPTATVPAPEPSAPSGGEAPGTPQAPASRHRRARIEPRLESRSER